MNENIKIFIKKRELYFLLISSVISIAVFWIGYGIGHYSSKARLGVANVSDSQYDSVNVAGVDEQSDIQPANSRSGIRIESGGRSGGQTVSGASNNQSASNIGFQTRDSGSTSTNTGNQSDSNNSSNGDSGSRLVASKTGTKYYTEGCSGIDRIKDENRIYFDTESEAVDAGYERASTCK